MLCINTVRLRPAPLHKPLGTSSEAKGGAFISTVFYTSLASPKPKTYASYSLVYTDPDVDIVYIGTPYSHYKEQCLAVIAAGKHVLCEKLFTINAAEAIAAARARGVYIMGGWKGALPLGLRFAKSAA